MRFVFRNSRRLRRGFTALELFVVIGILVILLSIFIPYLLKIREDNRRVRCANNLGQLSTALSNYAHLNYGDYPRVIYDAVGNPNGYTCYTGPDGGNPFAKNSTVKPNDVTASLWLLVRLKLIRPGFFICPSTDDEPDSVDVAGAELSKRGNFPGPVNLSYSYASPFSSARGYRLNDTRRADFALMADKNPGNAGDQSNAAGPAVDATALKLAVANSNNHRQAGQNVLYADGHVSAYLQSTPYCGISDEIHPELHDNIYTALAAKPLDKQYVPKYANGLLGNNVGPAWDSDSYLVPTATDKVPVIVAVIATQPATKPTSRPATIPTTTPVTTAPATTAPVTTAPTTRPATMPTTLAATRPTTMPTSRPTTKP